MSRRPARTLIVLALPLLAAAVLAAPPAVAAAYTSTGLRCTVVGTSGADTLHGTAGRDVLCGRGGADVLVGRGGDDVLDGGFGRDLVVGGDGDDTLLGGLGDDELRGGAGDDRLDGGVGDDLVVGGDGDDVLLGDMGDDDLRGRAGDDDLDGGWDGDAMNGGPGVNWCVTNDELDTTLHCVYDQDPPVVVGATLSRGSVDVTEVAQRVTVRLHVTDDTGTSSVVIGLRNAAGVDLRTSARLVSGTIRDGWWEVSRYVFRGIDPGPIHVYAETEDREERRSNRDLDTPILSVVDRAPDVDPPHLVSLRLPEPDLVVDTAGGSSGVTVIGRFADDLSGVGRIRFCMAIPEEDGSWYLAGCEWPIEGVQQGSVLDGTWLGEARYGQRAEGTWNLAVLVSDRAHPEAYQQYLGPDAYEAALRDGPDPDVHPLPDGIGRIFLRNQ